MFIHLFFLQLFSNFVFYLYEVYQKLQEALMQETKK